MSIQNMLMGGLDPYSLVNPPASISEYSVFYACIMYVNDNGTITVSGSHTGTGGSVNLLTERWFPEGRTPPPIYVSCDITTQPDGQPESNTFPAYASPGLLTTNFSMSVGGGPVAGGIYLWRSASGPLLKSFSFSLDYYPE